MAMLGPEAGLLVFILMAGVVAFAGATQDIAVDAYRIEIAPVEAQGALAATYTLGYRIALIASTVGVLYVAQYWSWRVAYLSMAVLMLVPAVTTLVAREPSEHRDAGPRAGFVEAFLGPFREFFSRNGVLLAVMLLAFVGLYKLPDQMLGVIAGPYYLDSGFDKADIANISKAYGIPIGILGAFVGGVAIPVIGLRWSLAVAAVRWRRPTCFSYSCRCIRAKCGRSWRRFPATISPRASLARCWWPSCRRWRTGTTPPPSTRCWVRWRTCPGS